jgi:MFS family permease
VSSARGAAVYLGVVQFFFATTWTLYVIYLPQLAAQAGIGKAWIPWILVADQVIFAVMDVVTGYWADRVRAGVARLGGWILGLSVVSAAAFVALPFAGASAAVLLGAILVWTLTSSALRSPPWALLSRYATAPSVPWLSALVLTGSAVAAAAAPYLGVAMRGVDPRLPFIVSTLTLLATVAGLIYVERRLAGGVAPVGEGEPPFDPRVPRAKALLGAFFIALFLMAVGFQAHFALNSAPQYLRFAAAADLQYLMPVFWIGFNVLMFPAAALVKRFGALPVMAASAAAGALATLGAGVATNLENLLLCQFMAGGCWGAISVGAFSAALAFGRTRREGAMVGSLFAVLALAAFVRIAAYAADMVMDEVVKALLPWIAPTGWLMAALLLLAVRPRFAASSRPA